MRTVLALALLLVAAAAPREGCGGRGTPAYDPCAGKACGDPCLYCPPGTDPANCPVPAAGACDAQLQCVSAGEVGLCSPQAACLGKSCGAACETCPACMDAIAEYCDASSACVKGGPPTCPQ